MSDGKMAISLAVKNGKSIAFRNESSVFGFGSSIAEMRAVSCVTAANGTLLSNGDVPPLREGVVWLRNLDSNNYAEWGIDDTGTLRVFGRLEPGEIAIFRREPGEDIRVQANGAAVVVEHFLSHA